jgi:hypothetical protein
MLKIKKKTIKRVILLIKISQPENSTDLSKAQNTTLLIVTHKKKSPNENSSMILSRRICDERDMFSHCKKIEHLRYVKNMLSSFNVY